MKTEHSLLFRGAFTKTRREMLVSVLVLLILTVLFAVAMFFTEHVVNPEFSFWDALVWIVVKYVDDPAEVVTPPRTVVGMVFGTLVGFMSVAIVAIPAGLFGSGFIDAMKDREREKELEEIRDRMKKAFNRWYNPTFNEFMNGQPEDIKKKFDGVKFVHSKIRVANLQSEKGIDVKDVLDICKKYNTKFRLRNMAKAEADEARADDCMCVEHFNRNREYGCCISRNSNVTIICPTSSYEIGMGWFTYYLAKFGGFNYISKEIEADPEEKDSFLNMSEKLVFEGAEYTTEDVGKMGKKDRGKDVLERKLKLRNEFLEDLNQLCGKDHSWVVVCLMHLTNNINCNNFHLAHALKDALSSTINSSDITLYDSFYDDFKTMLEKDGLTVSEPNSKRYPLTKRNLGYKIREKSPECNVFTLRVESKLINFDTRKHVLAYKIADLLSKKFDDARGIQEKDLEDLKRGGFGYMEERQ